MISKMINARRVSLNTSSAGYHCKDTAKEPVIKLVETPTSCCSSKARFAYKAKSQQFDQTGPTGTKYLALTSTICNQPEILYSCSCSCELWIDVGQKDAFPNTTFARCTCPSMCNSVSTQLASQVSAFETKGDKCHRPTGGLVPPKIGLETFSCHCRGLLRQLIIWQWGIGPQIAILTNEKDDDSPLDFVSVPLKIFKQSRKLRSTNSH